MHSFYRLITDTPCFCLLTGKMMLVSIEGVSRQETAQPDGSVLAGGIQTNKVNSGYKRHLPTKDRQDTPRKLS